MVVNVANLGRKPYIPLSSHINLMMNQLGFLMRGEIIWDKSASAGSSCAWGSFQSASNPCLRDVHELSSFSQRVITNCFEKSPNEKRDESTPFLAMILFSIPNQFGPLQPNVLRV